MMQATVPVTILPIDLHAKVIFSRDVEDNARFAGLAANRPVYNLTECNLRGGW